MIEAETLLAQVAVELEWLYSHVGTGEVALHQTPEVLQAVRVDFTANILNCVVHRFVDVILVERYKQPLDLCRPLEPDFTVVRISF